MMRSRPVRYLAATAVLAASFTVAGCSEDDPPAVCADVDALKASVAEVTDLEIDRGALSTLQESLAQVRSDLGKVRDDAKDEYAVEIDAVAAAAESVSSSLEVATTSPSAQAIADIGASVRAVGASLSALEDAVGSTC